LVARSGGLTLTTLTLGRKITGVSKSTAHNTIGLVLAIIGMGFSWQWFTHNPSKPEYQIARVWWNSDRPVHAVLFLLAAIFHYNGLPHTAGALIITDAAFSVANRWM
jgi:hypothetical protein